MQLKNRNSFVGGGFWRLNKQDLFRIRKEFEMSTLGIEQIISSETFRNYFAELEGNDGFKIAPIGFNMNHNVFDLIKKNSF